MGDVKIPKIFPIYSTHTLRKSISRRINGILKSTQEVTGHKDSSLVQQIENFVLLKAKSACKSFFGIKKAPSTGAFRVFGTPKGIRTPVDAMKTRSPRPG